MRVWTEAPTVRRRSRAASVQAVAPRNDRRVSIRSVRCPVCGVAPGQPCVSGTGTETSHPPRRVMALRAEPEASAEDLAYARRCSIARRAAAREAAGLDRVGLSRLLHVRWPLVADWERDRQVPVGAVGAAYGAWLRKQLEEAEPDA